MFCDDCCLLFNNVHMSPEGANAKMGNLGDAHNPGRSEKRQAMWDRSTVSDMGPDWLGIHVRAGNNAPSKLYTS
jgi:hypothetical protein